jgi:hypothetical protein
MTAAHDPRAMLRVPVERILAPALDRGEAALIRAVLDTVTENVYSRLPSGDYGRGDVRAVIVDLLDCADAHGDDWRAHA